MKHTPGPWKSTGSIPFINMGGDFKDVSDAQGNLIAWATPKNISLIASAPEMLSVLKFLAENADGYEDEGSIELMKRIKTILSKVESE